MRHGLITAPLKSRKILINSALTGAGRYGGRASNAIGCLALFYSTFDYLLDDHIFPYLDIRGADEYTPVFAAALTGAIYKSTSALHSITAPSSAIS